MGLMTDQVEESELRAFADSTVVFASANSLDSSLPYWLTILGVSVFLAVIFVLM
jgi:hypothetical protein